MTASSRKNRDVEIAIGVSVALHVVLLLWVAWETGRTLADRWAQSASEVVPVEEVTLLYPERILIPEPPTPKEEPKTYIRTTQNTAAAEQPEKADFISDRDTVAATELPADPEGDVKMPTQEGIDKPMLELADRDFKDGEIKEDGAAPVPPMPVAEPSPASAPPAPEPAPPPQPVVPPSPPPAEVARAEPVTPLEAMMREQDESEAALLKSDRLPLEVREAEPIAEPEMQEPVDQPPPVPEPPAQVPEMRSPAADNVPRAVPVPDPVSRTAGPADPDAFSPFTRTSKARGTLSNRGEAAVNAAETPVGRYMRQVTSAVEKKWHTLRRRNADAVTFGSLKLRFNVLPSGDVDPPRLLSDPKAADARMVDFTLRAILEAEIPPIPQDLLPLLEGGRLEVEYDVLIY